MSRRRAYLCAVALGVPLLGIMACSAILGTPDPILRDEGDGGAAIFEDSNVAPPVAADGRVLGDGNAGDALEAGPPIAHCCDDGGCSTSESCGSCLHSCLGGGCISGQCAPWPIVGSTGAYHGMKSLYGLVLIGATLYGTDWYTPNAVLYRASAKQYSPDPTPFYPADGGGRSAATAIVYDGSHLYFSAYRTEPNWKAGIYSVDLQGHGGLIVGGTDAGTPSDANSIGTIAVDTKYLYWAEVGSNSIWRANKDGTDVREVNAGEVGTVVVASGGRVYFRTGAGLIAADPEDLTKPLVSYSGSIPVDAFTVGTSSVFWADRTAARVYRAPLDGGSVSDVTPPGGLSMTRAYVGLSTDNDDERVYVVTEDFAAPAGAMLERFVVGGGPAETLASLNDAIAGMTQDSTALYFATYGNDTPDAPPYSALWKLAK